MTTSETNPHVPQFSFPSGEAWAPVRALYERLQQTKKHRDAQTTLARIGWAICSLASNEAVVTLAAIGRLCVATWGGPKPQSIANDKDGYAELVRLAKTAQSVPARIRPAGAGNDLPSRIVDPMARAEVQLLLAEVSALRGQLTTLKQGMRRMQALGPITAAMGMHQIDSLEQLAERIQEAARPTGLVFSAEERTAVRGFLDNLYNEGFTIEEATGEIYAPSGRRVARAGLLSAMRKMIQA